VNPFDPLKRWWQRRTGEAETPFDGDTPAWTVSLLFHLCVLIGLALFWQYLPPNQVTLTLNTAELDSEELTPQEFFVSKDPQPDIGANASAGVDAPVSLAPTIDEISDIPTDVAPVEVAAVRLELNHDIPTGLEHSADLLVKGAAGEGVTGATGAIDRITQEILRSLERRPTLVVWLFDQSGSLQRQRAEVYGRFDRIYEELGVIEQSGDETFAKHDVPLLTSVMAFGEKVTFITNKPTAKPSTIKKAVELIENDESGVEMVFSAVALAAERYKPYRFNGERGQRRNVMFVVFSDEAGDDQMESDRAIQLCNRLQIRVHVVGVPAPFGREEATVKYVDPDPRFDQSVQWIPVRQGPETLLPERLKLSFAGSGSDDSLERIDSGFGPYNLTRLCYETGGIYFAVHPGKTVAARAARNTQSDLMLARLDHFFDPAVMRSYQPDYMSIEQYKALLSSNKACAALVNAAQMSHLDPMENPRMRFPVRDEARLKQALDRAQQAAAILTPKIIALHRVLEDGQRDRARVTAPRWAAGYDLAMGRVLAVRVRTEGYNAMLAKAKGGMKFENEKNDTWLLRPADEINVGSAMEKLADRAREYLRRVIDQHADTPWALLAAEELKEPLGWQWTETYTGVNAPRPRPPGNANPQPPPDRANQVPQPEQKPRRKVNL